MVVRLLVLNGECVVAASFLFLQTSLCSQKNNISSPSPSQKNPEIPHLLQKNNNITLWIPKKRIISPPSSSSQKSPSYLYGSPSLYRCVRISLLPPKKNPPSPFCFNKIIYPPAVDLSTPRKSNILPVLLSLPLFIW